MSDESNTSKTPLESKNILIAVAVIGLSAFNVFQDFSAGGIQSIQETDVSIILMGIAHITTRLTDKTARKIRVRSDSYHKRKAIDKMFSDLDKD